MNKKNGMAGAIALSLLVGCAAVPSNGLPQDAMAVSSVLPSALVIGEWKGFATVKRTGSCPMQNGDRAIDMSVSMDSPDYVAEFRTSGGKPWKNRMLFKQNEQFDIEAAEIGEAICAETAVREVRNFSGRFLQSSDGLYVEMEADLNACKAVGCTFRERRVFRKVDASAAK